MNFTVESFSDFLDKRERFIIYERFANNKKWKDIAKELNVSVTYTIMLYDKILIKLKKHFKKEK
jgi:DNA-directed RNA polymerase specialized sigma subunit